MRRHGAGGKHSKSSSASKTIGDLSERLQGYIEQAQGLGVDTTEFEEAKDRWLSFAEQAYDEASDMCANEGQQALVDAGFELWTPIGLGLLEGVSWHYAIDDIIGTVSETGVENYEAFQEALEELIEAIIEQMIQNFIMGIFGF